MSFTINLLVVNLLSILLFLPLVTMDLVMSPVSLPGQCLLTEAVSHMIASLSLLSTLLIAVDQYLAILHALRYHHHMTRLRSSLSLGSVWVLSSIISVIAVCLGQNENIFWKSCQEAHPSENSHHWYNTKELFSSGISIASFIVPTLFMIIIYSKIYLEAHNSSERTRKCSLKPSDTTNSIAIVVPPETKLHARYYQGLEPADSLPGRMRRFSTSHSVQMKDKRFQRKASLPTNPLIFKENIRRRISNAGQFIQREEGKTAKIYIISVAAVVFCWGPLFIIQALHQFLHLHITPWTSFLILYLSNLYAAVSPFIFAFRNKKVRREVLEMLEKRTQEENIPPIRTFPVTKVNQHLSSKPPKSKSEETFPQMLRFLKVKKTQQSVERIYSQIQ